MELNWANRITIFRILMIVPFVACMLKINDTDVDLSIRHWLRYAAVFIFFAMAFSDIIDGFVARRNGQVTRLGSFLDPMADKLLMTCACLLLSYKGTAVEGFQLPQIVVVLVIGKDLFLLIGFLTIYFLTFKVHIIPASIGKIATTLQLSMVAGILLGPEMSHIIPGWLWVLKTMWWSAAGTAILATFIYIRAGNRYLEDYEQSNG